VVSAFESQLEQDLESHLDASPGSVIINSVASGSIVVDLSVDSNSVSALQTLIVDTGYTILFAGTSLTAVPSSFVINPASPSSSSSISSGSIVGIVVGVGGGLLVAFGVGIYLVQRKKSAYLNRGASTSSTAASHTHFNPAFDPASVDRNVKINETYDTLPATNDRMNPNYEELPAMMNRAGHETYAELPGENLYSEPPTMEGHYDYVPGQTDTDA